MGSERRSEARSVYLTALSGDSLWTQLLTFSLTDCCIMETKKIPPAAESQTRKWLLFCGDGGGYSDFTQVSAVSAAVPHGRDTKWGKRAGFQSRKTRQHTRDAKCVIRLWRWRTLESRNVVDLHLLSYVKTRWSCSQKGGDGECFLPDQCKQWGEEECGNSCTLNKIDGVSGAEHRGIRVSHLSIAGLGEGAQPEGVGMKR